MWETMKNKRWYVITLLLVTVFALALSGCAKKDDLVLGNIKKAGKMTVGTSPDYPPFETIDESGNIIGFDIDLLQAIGEEMGVKIELKPMSFETIVTAVQNGQVDIGMSGFSVDPERALLIDFSDPYYEGGQVVITTSTSGVTKLEDLKGKVVAVQMGTTGADAAAGIEGATVKQLDDFNMAIAMLKNGGAKAVVADMSVAEEYIAREGLIQVGDPLAFEENAIVVQKNNPSLLSALNNALANIKASGKYDELMTKWEMK